MDTHLPAADRAFLYYCVYALVSGAIMHLSMLAPTPLPGEVRQSWGFDLIRIQLPPPPGNVRIQILMGHALRVFRMRTSAIQYPDPWDKLAIPNKENSPPCPGWGGANIDRCISIRDPYICAVSRRVCANIDKRYRLSTVPKNRSLSSTGPLSVQ